MLLRRFSSGGSHRGRGEYFLDDMLCGTGILRVRLVRLVRIVRVVRRCAGISDILLGANRTSGQARVA